MCMAHSPLNVQAISRSELSTPSWFGEVVFMVGYLRKHSILTKPSRGDMLCAEAFWPL
jgi:hypothetical protein